MFKKPNVTVTFKRPLISFFTAYLTFVEQNYELCINLKSMKH